MIVHTRRLLHSFAAMLDPDAYGRAFSEGYDAGYVEGRSRSYSDGYDRGFMDGCLVRPEAAR